MNATNYKLFSPNQIEDWAAKIKRPDFRFCPKAFRGLSFMGPSDKRAVWTEKFFESIAQFGNYLGPVYLTNKQAYNPQYQNDFANYVGFFSQAWPLFVEQRDPDFFASTTLQQEYYQMLTHLGVGSVITNTAGRPDVCHMRLTVPRTFIRFVGNSLHRSDFPRIDQWVARIKTWLEKGIEEVYFFLHMHDEGLSPEITRYPVDQLNKHCNLQLPPVIFVK